MKVGEIWTAIDNWGYNGKGSNICLVTTDSSESYCMGSERAESVALSLHEGSGLKT